MKEEAFASRLGALAGIGTWVVIGIPVLLELFADPSKLVELRWLLWLGAYLSFGVLFALISQERLEQLSRGAHRALLALQSLLVTVALFALPQYGFTAILFIVTASHAAHVLPLRAGFGWVVAQTVVTGVVTTLAYADTAIATVQTLAYFSFQVFALLTTHSALKEAAARQALAQQSAELRATHELLTESSRIGERVRIARELHDLIGHHLTALSLNLEVAGHLTEGKGKTHVEKAHALTKLLLADVREVVSSMRDGNGLDLASALTALVRDIPRPAIHLSVPEDLGVEDVVRAQVILRCVQEIITNTIRHAGAKNLWISLERTPEGVSVHAWDDGKGSREVRSGNGLKGMRERFESLGGKLQVSSSPGQGFTLEAWLPGAAQA